MTVLKISAIDFEKGRKSEKRERGLKVGGGKFPVLEVKRMRAGECVSRVGVKQICRQQRGGSAVDFLAAR